ncbi:hypothetical protein [Propionibacterium sp. oral taxon 192]|uniref:hypothetical protein n=1 Tax=Propionibacterium sp. oral taxon 192 TaxID=671222 RepID=UPI003FA49F8B
MGDALGGAVAQGDDGGEATRAAAGSYHTVGLTAWGTVVSAGRSDFGQCDVSAWKDVVTIATGGAHTVGLRSEGSVIGVGSNDCGELHTEGWRLF